MPVVFVIYAPRNSHFVTEHLLPPLPPLGFDSWLSAEMITGKGGSTPDVEHAIGAADAVLAVLTEEACGNQHFAQQLDLARRVARHLIPVRHVTTWREKWGEAVSRLSTVQTIEPPPDDTFNDRVLQSNLAALLPPSREVPTRHGVLDRAQRIPWNADIYSTFLKSATTRHDYEASVRLITSLRRYLESAKAAYQASYARRDLTALRNERLFALMRDYAEAALAFGTTDFRVRRQYAQALIELGRTDLAITVLQGIVQDAKSTDGEWAEAQGLLGRAYKQRYVDAPTAPDAKDNLERALNRYGVVFSQDGRNIWHGINLVSLLQRGVRDGVLPKAAEEDGTVVARRILNTLTEREMDARKRRADSKDDAPRPSDLDVWDVATRVEAFVGVGDRGAASDCLDGYLSHPDMHAFEVSSTYRQFKDVLELDPENDELMKRLWDGVARHRTGGAPTASESSRNADRTYLVRLADPSWKPADPAIMVTSQLGTIASVTGTERILRTLLMDPLVVSVDESRIAAQTECRKSVPYINVTDPFPGVGGATFSEKGRNTIVAVIDDGFDILHETFLDTSGKSRIIGIWDQRDPTGPAPAGFTLGTYHSEQNVAGYIATRVLPSGLSARDPGGHGTHVASIAAGRGLGQFGGGVAQEARLLFVVASNGESVGYSRAHLEALKLIDQVATERNVPVVVNVSQGQNAGAHDGKSALEVGFDEFSGGGRKPGRVVVKSSGNEGDRRGHAELALAAGERTSLPWTCVEGVWMSERIELWWSAANEYRFQLVDPSGQTTPWIDLQNPKFSDMLGMASCSLELVRRHVDNGDSRLNVALSSPSLGESGERWSLTVQNVKRAEPEPIHAWIERNNIGRSSFLNHESSKMTITIPGTANSVITVSAVGVPAQADDGLETGIFSSAGPTRDGRKKPEICAPGVNIEAAKAGTAKDAIVMDGTSMAAPHVTGAVALVLSRAGSAAGGEWPTASQVLSTIRQNTKNYSGTWTPGQGFGVLDVRALLNGIS